MSWFLKSILVADSRADLGSRAERSEKAPRRGCPDLPRLFDLTIAQIRKKKKMLGCRFSEARWRSKPREVFIGSVILWVGYYHHSTNITDLYRNCRAEKVEFQVNSLTWLCWYQSNFPMAPWMNSQKISAAIFNYYKALRSNSLKSCSRLWWKITYLQTVLNLPIH